MERFFNRRKYKELVLHIISEAGKLPHFGDILLNKILVDCDLTAYKELGQPMTGQKVQHERLGPISAALKPVTREMVQLDGTLETGWSDFYGNTQRRYIAKREPDLAQFSDQELQIIGERIEFWSKMNGTEASRASHEIFGGWVFTTDHQEIPYETAYISKHPLSQADKDYALELIGSE